MSKLKDWLRTIYWEVRDPDYVRNDEGELVRPVLPLWKRAIAKTYSKYGDIRSWIRVRTVYKSHTLKLFDKPGYRCTSEMVDPAIIELAKFYIEKELGHVSTLEDKSEFFDNGEKRIHRGYLLVHGGDEEYIDLILEMIDLYNVRFEKCPFEGKRFKPLSDGKFGAQVDDQKVYDWWRDHCDRDDAARNRLTELFKEFIEKRYGLWA